MREDGYYWVYGLGDWSIAFWNGSYWNYISTLFEFNDEDFDEIDERKIERL